VNVTTDISQASGSGQGVGTGFIVRSDGVIVTNCHVVEAASKITVFTSDANPKQFNARVIGSDCLHDLAILKIDAKDMPTVTLGNSADLALGQRVVALGYALALEGGPTVTSGIVSSLDRTITAQDPNCLVETCGTDQTRTYSNVIQTDAAINHGNSGGPLVNMQGQVVGINSAGDDNAQNIGFAIAIDSVKQTIADAETRTRGGRLRPASASARSMVPSTRLLRMRRLRWSLQRVPTVSPARCTTASRPSRPAWSITPAAGSQWIASRRPRRLLTAMTSCPPVVRKGIRAVPRSPVAPVTATRSRGPSRWRAWAARSSRRVA